MKLIIESHRNSTLKPLYSSHPMQKVFLHKLQTRLGDGKAHWQQFTWRFSCYFRTDIVRRPVIPKLGSLGLVKIRRWDFQENLRPIQNLNTIVRIQIQVPELFVLAFITSRSFVFSVILIRSIRLIVWPCCQARSLRFIVASPLPCCDAVCFFSPLFFNDFAATHCAVPYLSSAFLTHPHWTSCCLFFPAGCDQLVSRFQVGYLIND